MPPHARRCSRCNRLIPRAAPSDVCEACRKPKVKVKPKRQPEPEPELKPKTERKPVPTAHTNGNGSNGRQPAINAANGVCRICGWYIPPKRRRAHEAGLDIKNLECSRQDLAAIFESIRKKQIDWMKIPW